MVQRSWAALGTRPAFFVALAVVAGAAWGPVDGVSPGLLLGSSTVLALCAVVFSRRVGAHLALLLAALAAGAALATSGAVVEVPLELQREDGASYLLEGRLEEVTQSRGALRVLMAVSRVEGSEGGARFRALLYASGAPSAFALRASQRVLLRARLARPAGPDNPGQYDRRPVLARRAIPFTGSFEPAGVVPLSEAPRWTTWVEEVRQRLTRRTFALAPSREAAALYLTLAAGLRAELGEELEEDFSKSGLAHVLSVSGLHVAALALALYAFSRRALAWVFPSRHFDVGRLAGPLAVPLVWAYVIFTGTQLPAVRSAVMATAALLAVGLWRRADALNSLSVAALALIVLDPANVVDLSCQLSFISVAALVLVGPAVRDLLPTTPKSALGRMAETGAQALCASAAATIASAPLVASAFHRVSLAGLVSNVVSLPLSGALTALACFGAAASVLSDLVATPLVWLGTRLCSLLLVIAQLFASLPGASVPMGAFSGAVLALYYGALGVFSLTQGRYRVAAGVTPLLCLLSNFLPPRAPDGVAVTFLAVGHGDAIVLRAGDRVALIDGGGNPRGADVGARVVLPFLLSQGIRHLELAVLSHPHPDHALGLISTLEQIPTRRLWTPARGGEGPLIEGLLRSAASALVEEVEAGSPPFTLGPARLEVLGPPRDDILLEGVNDRSVVLRVTHGSVSILLTGDVERDGEEVLTVAPTTVVKAPHHGSRTSSSERLIEGTRPRYVIFCVGRRNRFGFPHEEVVERWARAGARCLRTDVHGAITLRSDGESVAVETFHPDERVTGPASTSPSAQ